MASVNSQPTFFFFVLSPSLLGWGEAVHGSTPNSHPAPSLGFVLFLSLLGELTLSSSFLAYLKKRMLLCAPFHF